MSTIGMLVVYASRDDNHTNCTERGSLWRMKQNSLETDYGYDGLEM